jgi:hypothetical protein
MNCNQSVIIECRADGWPLCSSRANGKNKATAGMHKTTLIIRDKTSDTVPGTDDDS